MKRISKLLLVFVLSIFVFTTEALADTKNEVTLNFEEGIIHDGYVEYEELGKIQLLKDDAVVVDINNNMKIDLNEAEYKLKITETTPSQGSGSVAGTALLRLTINSWKYAILEEPFKLDTDKFSGTLNIKLERTGTVINTKVEKEYSDLKVTGIIDLSKDYVIDFTKDDDLTNSLKLFANLRKTMYYKNVDGKLVETENEDEAIIKIVGNLDENKAIITAINVGDKKEEKLKDLTTRLSHSKLQYIDSEEGIINEIRTEYYVNCDYDYTFIYKVEKPPVVTPPTEGKTPIENPKTGDSIIAYFILSIISVVGVITSVMINNQKKEEY